MDAVIFKEVIDQCKKCHCKCQPWWLLILIRIDNIGNNCPNLQTKLHNRQFFRQTKDIKPTKTGSSNGWNGHDVNFEFVSSTNSNQTISIINELDWSMNLYVIWSQKRKIELWLHNNSESLKNQLILNWINLRKH